MIVDRVRSIFFTFQRLFGQYKFQMGLLILLGFLNGLLGVIGITALIPLFSFLMGQTDPGDDNIFSSIIASMLQMVHIPLSVHSVLYLMVVLFILKAIALYIFKYVGMRIFTYAETKMRSDLYRGALQSSWGHLLKQKVGFVENVLMADVSGALKLLAIGASLILNFTSMVMYAAVAIKISPFITLAAIGAGAIMLGMLKPLLRRVRKLSRMGTYLGKDIAHEINENVAGLKALKAMGAEEEAARAAIGFFERVRDIRIRGGMFRAISTVAIQPVSMVFIAVAFTFLSKGPDFKVAAFITVIYLIQQIFVFVERTQDSLHDIQEAIPHASQVLAFQEATRKHREKDEGTEGFSFHNSLEFHNVSFGYADKKVLDGMNLHVSRGQMVGIVGPSGVGKTTIVDIILRLFDPQAGEIVLDGTDIRNIKLRDWRRNIGYVSQDIFLKNSTVRENIVFYDESITEEGMVEAAKMAHAYEFIKKLPKGFDSWVGERGVTLSGGQRQRIVLARALARKPKILILDEATSAVDNESEHIIQQAITSLKGGMTIIVIAHRLSTVMGCDTIIALSDGKILEQGNPQTLLADPTSYFYRTHALAQ